MYMENTPIKSKCGANIRIEVVDTATGEPARPDLIQDVVLEVCILPRFARGCQAWTALTSLRIVYLCSCHWWTASSTRLHMRMKKTLPLVSFSQEANQLPRYDWY